MNENFYNQRNTPAQQLKIPIVQQQQRSGRQIRLPFTITIERVNMAVSIYLDFLDFGYRIYLLFL